MFTCCLLSSHLKQQVEVLQESLSRLGHQMGVVNHWQQSVMSQLKHHLDLLHLTFLATGASSGKVAKWVKVIQAAQQTHKNDCDGLLHKVGVMGKRFVLFMLLFIWLDVSVSQKVVLTKFRLKFTSIFCVFKVL